MPSTDTVRQVKLDRLSTVGFRRHLAAEHKAPRTVETYLGAVKVLGGFLEHRGMPTDPAIISREHIEGFIADQLHQWKPATANNHYRALQASWKWLDDEGELVDATIRPRRLNMLHGVPDAAEKPRAYTSYGSQSPPAPCKEPRHKSAIPC